MDFLPLIHRGDRLKALVVGGGEVALRKVRDLLEAGAKVEGVSPEIHPELQQIIDERKLKWTQRIFYASDIMGHNLLVVATDDAVLNMAVYLEARDMGIPINVVDQPELCTVYFAAIAKHDPLLLAVSTGGAAPFFAREFRKELESWIDEKGWDLRAQWAAVIRKFALRLTKDVEQRECLFRRFMDEPLDAIRQWDFERPPEELWREWTVTDDEANRD